MQESTIQDYYAALGPNYMDGSPSLVNYHELRFRTAEELLDLPSGASVFEFGIGDGALAVRLKRRGFIVSGCDLSPTMVALARNHGADAKEGGIDVLATLPPKSYDGMIALNVLPYLSDDEEDEFYRQAARVVRPGGSILISHTNRLLDYVSLNRYSVEAVSALIDRVVGLSPEERGAAKQGYRSTLTAPAVPPPPRPPPTHTSVAGAGTPARSISANEIF